MNEQTNMHKPDADKKTILTALGRNIRTIHTAEASKTAAKSKTYFAVFGITTSQLH